MSTELNLVAKRYADALFAFASEQKQHDAVKQDMLTLQSAFAQSEALTKFLVNPVITREQSAQVMEAVLDSLKASATTRKFFALLAQERRLAVAPQAVVHYLALLAASRNELQVEVISATVLTAVQVSEITAALSKSTGKTVSVKTAVNEDLIGGLQVRMGSTMLDNSVAGKLARLHTALTKAA